MEILTRYTPQNIENQIYNFWLQKDFFHSLPDERPSYTVVIPPPNITGILHMGHMLNNTFQDVLVRRSRMIGYNTCWVPGTDHASIATEAKIVSHLKEKKLTKSKIGREAFLKLAWEWTHKHRETILNQLKKLGCSCNWKYTRFTMEKSLSNSVIRCFIDLYRRGLIYREYRMVNWDPEAKTTISDEEVIYKECKGILYYIKYPILGKKEYLIIATTRPETLLGDTAVCVHPSDDRFSHLKMGESILVPIIQRIVPLIKDEYVDREFGSGCLKMTPSHDVNDQILAKKYHLEFIDILNEDGTLNEHAFHYHGKDRFHVRKEIVQELREKGFLIKEESLIHKVGVSERTGSLIESRRSMQWFLKTTDMAKQAIEAVKNGEIHFHPPKIENIYKNWMEKIQDWNISRQLWWGHRIPVYYYNNNIEDYIVAETKEEALNLARKKINCEKITLDMFNQDEDVLDTWFSSWLWPISVFDGISSPNNKSIQYYYPTKDLVTGPDILFFWVARMIMAGYTFINKKPFENVCFTGIVRDNHNKKMSKSLGNSPNPITLMNQYGTDGVRVGLLLNSKMGNDLIFNEKLCFQGRNFANKIWNAFRLIKSWKTDFNAPILTYEKLAIKWFENRFYQVLEQIDKLFEKYKISDTLNILYNFFWDDFCSWYLEIVKPSSKDSVSYFLYSKTFQFFENLMKLLHPYMPFLTEEIWQQIKVRADKEALIISSWPKNKKIEEKIIKDFCNIMHLVIELRSLRKRQRISSNISFLLSTCINDEKSIFYPVVLKLENISELSFLEEKPINNKLSFLVGTQEYFVSFEGQTNLYEEIQKLKKSIEYYKDFLAYTREKLSNKHFVSNAPQRVVHLEMKKESDTINKIKMLQDRLKIILEK